MTEKPSVPFNAAVGYDELAAGLQAIVLARVAELPLEVRERIVAAARSATPMTLTEPLAGGWVALRLDLLDGGPCVELGKVTMAAFAREPLDPN